MKRDKKSMFEGLFESNCENADAATENNRVFSNEPVEDLEPDLAGEYAEMLIGNSEDDSDDSQRSNSPVALVDYVKAMQEKYEDEIGAMSHNLNRANSYQRGAVLFDIIGKCRYNELKYYLFYEYWDCIDKSHELYIPSLVSEWLTTANVQLDLSGLEVDKEGFVTIYRGENTYSFPWKKGALSWTTSREVAEKFARGVRLRIQTATQPKVIVGKVHKDNILARMDEREEFELICKDVVFLNEIKLKSNNK